MTRTGYWVGLLLTLLLPAVACAAAAPPDAFSADFVQKRTLPDFDQPIVSHGHMRFNTNGGFHWEVNRPYHYVFDMQDGQAHEEMPDGTQRQLDPDDTPWLQAVARLFRAALSDDRSALKAHFDVTTTDLDNGRRLTLKPHDDALADVIERIRVTESAPGKPRRLVVAESSGARMDIRFSTADASTDK